MDGEVETELREKEPHAPKKPKSGKSRFDRNRHGKMSCIGSYPKLSGNSVSPSKARPTVSVESFFNRLDTQDIIKYLAVDVRPSGNIYRKTACPLFESLKFRRMNKQEHEKYKNTNPNTHRTLPEYCIHLPDIHENLYLSNYEYAAEHASDFNTIINLSHMEIKTKKEINMEIFYMQDDITMSYNNFEEMVLKILRVLHCALQRGDKVLVHCRAGVNRSPVAVTAYAVLRKGKKLNDVIRYIETLKLNAGFSVWDTITNRKFINFLNILNSKKVFRL